MSNEYKYYKENGKLMRLHIVQDNDPIIVMKIICGHPKLKQPASFHRGHTILLLR